MANEFGTTGLHPRIKKFSKSQSASTLRGCRKGKCSGLLSVQCEPVSEMLNCIFDNVVITNCYASFTYNENHSYSIGVIGPGKDF